MRGQGTKQSRGHCRGEKLRLQRGGAKHRITQSGWSLGILRAGAIHTAPLWPSEESMHRWSPHCALGWLQAELEEAEQEAEVRGAAAGLGEREGDPSYYLPTSFSHCRLESTSSRKPALSA